MKRFRILHLSDIHIGDTFMEAGDIAFRIIGDLENYNVSDIQCVVVTGDIFEGRYGFSDDLINEAIKFFTTIYQELSESTNIGKEDFLFVPGNHDIIRDEDQVTRWKKYNSFLTGFYGSIPDFYDKDDFSLLKVYNDNKIAFAGFNSVGLKEEPLVDELVIKGISKIEESHFTEHNISKDSLLDFLRLQPSTKNYIDFGDISQKQILRMKRELSKYSDYNIVAFFHHHFYLFPEVYSKYGDSSLIRNYTNVIQQLQQANVKTVLHGHKHFDLERPLITDSYYENAKDVINVIAGGSIGTNRVTKHTFNVIDFFDKDNDTELVQRKFVYNNDQLEPITIRQIPPKVNENNSGIHLLNVLKLNATDLYTAYTDSIDKINIVANDYSNLMKWLENVFIGFNEIHRLFEKDKLCIFFLLYAMNYRVLRIKEVFGQESIDSSYFSILDDLLLNSIPEVGFNKQEYLKLFGQSDLNKLKEQCDQIFDTVQDKKAKYYLSFSMISIFFTDIYLMLRYYAGSFYNRYIQYKVNIRLDETEFHQNIPVQKIMIHSDADRRSAYIDLRCNSATAHKLAVLFVKEFELIISKFEDYFKTVGLKLYYILPKIEKNNNQNAIDNYNFEAYIPTLIPLLTGDNIYAKKEVFARELIQNSIDAIAVRASTDCDFDKTIYITLGTSEGRKFFRIKDCGTGMDRFKIERYFTSIGRSFYSGDEYRDLEINYKPISNFGIGFLSAFMICREIDVKTKYYKDETEGLKLHIPNFDGCFFIEKDDSIDIGTEITLYIDKSISHDIQFDTIESYISNTMQDVEFDILIRNEITSSELLLSSRNIRKRTPHNDVLFIPFSNSGTVIENVGVENSIWTKEFIDKYPYGLLIDITRSKSIHGVLNSGIRMCETDTDDIWKMILGGTSQRFRYFYNFFSFNFPSNYLNIDVSREKITSFTKVISPDFKCCLMNQIFRQLMEYIQLCKIRNTDNRAINLHALMMTLEQLCQSVTSLQHVQNSLISMRYVLYFRFNQGSIDIFIGRLADKPKDAISYIQSNYSKCLKAFNQYIIDNFPKDTLEGLPVQMMPLRRLVPDIYEIIDRAHFLEDEDFEEFCIYNIVERELFRYNSQLSNHLKKAVKVKDDTSTFAIMLLSAFMRKEKDKQERITVMETFLAMLLDQFSVFEIENGKGAISIQNDDIGKAIKKLRQMK